MTTSETIYIRLAERYSLKDGWITMGEVQPLGCSRRFDALSIMGWASRGHEALGFEIKVSRGDWLRELKDVAKADPLVRLCTRWWVCAPPGVVEKAELPEAWGLLVFHEGRIVAAKQAPRLSPDPWPPELWRCFLLRHATRRTYEQTELTRAEDKGYAAGYAAGKKQAESFSARDRDDLRRLRETVRRAEEAAGVQITDWMDLPALGLAIRALSSDGAGIRSLAYRMGQASETLKDLALAIEAEAAPGELLGKRPG